MRRTKEQAGWIQGHRGGFRETWVIQGHRGPVTDCPDESSAHRADVEAVASLNCVVD
jgi:hypothetical protein